MPYLIFLTIFSIIFDLRILKRIHLRVYDEVFKVFFKVVAIFSYITLVAVLFAEDKEIIVAIFCMIIVSPLYLVRRNRFINKIGDKWSSFERESIISDACNVVVLWMLSIFLIQAVFEVSAIFYDPFFTKMEIAMMSSLMSSVIVLFVLYKASLNFPGKNFLSRLNVRKTKSFVLLSSVIAIGFGLIFAFISALILTSRDIQPETSFGNMMEGMDTASGFILFLIAAMIMAPFVEEIIFRGYFFYVVKKVKGKFLAVISIALAFSFMHIEQYWGDIFAIMAVTALGFVLTLLRAFYGSVIPSIIMHYTYNISIVIFSIMMVAAQNPFYFDFLVNHDKYDIGTNIDLLKENISQNPEFTDAYQMLSVLYLESGDLDAALATIEKALDVYPKRPYYLDTKAVILIRSNREREAFKIRDVLRKNNPRYEIGNYINMNKI